MDEAEMREKLDEVETEMLDAGAAPDEIISAFELKLTALREQFGEQ